MSDLFRLMTFMMYFAAGGATYAAFRVHFDRTCPKCSDPDHGGHSDHAAAALFYGLLWFIFAPWAGAAILVNSLSPSRRDSVRRTRELEEAHHQTLLCHESLEQDRLLELRIQEEEERSQ